MAKISILLVGFIALILSAYIQGSSAAGPTINMDVNPTIPDAGKMTKLTFVGKTADGKTWEHVDYRIIVYKGDDEIMKHEFHTHAGTLELEVIPEETSDFVVEVLKEDHEEHDEHDQEESTPPAETSVEQGEGKYSVTGPLFLEKGDYKITAQIIGIEFNPLPPASVVTQEFALQVVPEFPLAVLIPMALAFAGMISVARFRKVV
jgi:hypothetical protein